MDDVGAGDLHAHGRVDRNNQLVVDGQKARMGRLPLGAVGVVKDVEVEVDLQVRILVGPEPLVGGRFERQAGRGMSSWKDSR